MIKEDLIILGNGFDLACGLKFSYSDFYKSRIDEFIVNFINKILFGYKFSVDISSKSMSVTSIGSALDFSEIFLVDDVDLNQIKNNYSHLNFWDLLFLSEQLDNVEWNNIELQMVRVLTQEKYNSQSFLTIMNSISVYGNLQQFVRIKILMVLAKLMFPEERYLNKTNEKFLLDELKLLEESFSKYLSKEISENSYLYKEKSFELLDIICEKNNLSGDQKRKRFFSFNYTDPGKCDTGCLIENIHGSLKNNDIIFGIDQKGIDYNDYAYQYTKTFRQMTSKNHQRRFDSILPNKNNIDSIKFFGHSLSKSDYSYFQSIFDYYELYSSNVTLIFYYKPYGEKTKEVLQVEQAKLVTEMLKDYSETLDNVNHGENLIHKLLLDQRLIISSV